MSTDVDSFPSDAANCLATVELNISIIFPTPSPSARFLEAKIGPRNRAETRQNWRRFCGIYETRHAGGGRSEILHAVGGRAKRGKFCGGESEGGLINCLASDLRGQWA